MSYSPLATSNSRAICASAKGNGLKQCLRRRLLTSALCIPSREPCAVILLGAALSTLQRSPYEHACITASHTMSEQVQNAENDDADDAFQTPKYWDAFSDGEEVSRLRYSAGGRHVRRVPAGIEAVEGERPGVGRVGCGTASHLAALAKYADVRGVDFWRR